MEQSKLAKRIIPCLDIKDGRTVKGVNFVDIIDAGDPVELAKAYTSNGADELVFLDITASNEKRKTLTALVKRIAKEINIPFTVGGGVSSIDDTRRLLLAGADKIAINSAAIYNPELITSIATAIGNQSLVVAIDAKLVGGSWKVFSHGGIKETGLNLLDWAKQVATLGAGEILFTSMNADGTKQGFETDALDELCKTVNIPIIASGGAGSEQDFIDVFTKTNVDAALAASVFHFGTISIPTLKQTLINNHITIRPCK